MTEIKAVINDIDGNLILSEEPCWHLENEIFRQMKLPPMTRQIHHDTWGMKLGEAVIVRSNGKADVETFWQLFPKVYQQFVESGRLDSVTKENLAAIKQIRLMKLGHIVLTSRTSVERAHLMNPKSPLASVTDAFYYKENMKYQKPDPRAFEHIESEHGLKPSECVYVGDQPTDAIAANGAGLYFIANLEEGLRSKEDFADYRVNAYIDKFTDLPAVLKDISM